MPVAGGAGCGMCTRHCACGTALALRGRTEGAQPGNAHNRAADVVDLTTAPDLTYRTDGADGVGDADELNPASRVGEAPGTATRARPAKGAYTVDCDGGLTRDDSSDEGEQLSFVSLNYDDADLRDLRVAFGLGSDVTKHLCSKEKRAARQAARQGGRMFRRLSSRLLDDGKGGGHQQRPGRPGVRPPAAVSGHAVCPLLAAASCCG